MVSTSTALGSISASISRQQSLNEEPRYVKKKVNATVILPDSSFTLLHRDDSTEFDEEIQVQHEDPKYVK